MKHESMKHNHPLSARAFSLLFFYFFVFFKVEDAVGRRAARGRAALPARGRGLSGGGDLFAGDGKGFHQRQGRGHQLGHGA